MAQSISARIEHEVELPAAAGEVEHHEVLVQRVGQKPHRAGEGELDGAGEERSSGEPAKSAV